MSTQPQATDDAPDTDDLEIAHNASNLAVLWREGEFDHRRYLALLRAELMTNSEGENL